MFICLPVAVFLNIILFGLLMVNLQFPLMVNGVAPINEGMAADPWLETFDDAPKVKDKNVVALSISKDPAVVFVRVTPHAVATGVPAVLPI
jgi:hypothetical protein